MRCNHCRTHMVETRRETNRASWQVWFRCPLCARSTLQTQAVTVSPRTPRREPRAHPLPTAA